MPVLQRLTTNWIDTEDRIRLAGECADGALVRLWLTRRLADRLLPVLLDWLGGGGDVRASLVQEFAQQAARDALAPQAAVPADAGDDVLIRSVDVARGSAAVHLVFHGGKDRADRPSWELFLEQQPLRQWLAILYDQYCKADWPMGLWPAWIALEGPQQAALH